MASFPFSTVDVFTTARFTGNPLAIVSLPPDHGLTQEAKQRVAREFNLSETVFLHEPSDPSSEDRSIDIFTPNEELPFAGHPTIGSATFVLSKHPHVKALITKAGRIPIQSSANGIRAAVPHDVHVHNKTLRDVPVNVELGHGDQEVANAERAAHVVSIVKGMTFVLVQLASLDQLAKISCAGPSLDFGGLGLLDEGPWGESFVSRYHFVVEYHEDNLWRIRTRLVEKTMEDPATGSAACTLASNLALATGGDQLLRFEITQGVEMGRRSEIVVEVLPGVDEKGKPCIKEVHLGGSAVPVMHGTLTT
jgi:PhzF family phenazine biosynthesis protein